MGCLPALLRRLMRSFQNSFTIKPPTLFTFSGEVLTELTPSRVFPYSRIWQKNPGILELYYVAERDTRLCRICWLFSFTVISIEPLICEMYSLSRSQEMLQTLGAFKHRPFFRARVRTATFLSNNVLRQHQHSIQASACCLYKQQENCRCWNFLGFGFLIRIQLVIFSPDGPENAQN